MSRKTLPGLTAALKEKLIQQGLERRLRQVGAPATPARALRETGTFDIPEQFTRFDLHPGYQQLRIIADGAARVGIGSPFFKNHEGIAGGRTCIGGREFLNFSSYNYLGLCGHPAISQAAVIGIPDARLGEVGMAFVVLRPGMAATASEIISWSRDEMAMRGRILKG